MTTRPLFSLCAATVACAALCTHAVVIVSPGLPPGREGVPYTFPFVATGGVPPYVWQVASNLPPSGVDFDDDAGILSGVPDTVETATFQIAVFDSGADSAMAEFTMVVQPAADTLFFETAGLPYALQDAVYTEEIQVQGGSAPYTWAVVTGALPAGITLSTNTGVVAGMPGAAGNAAFDVAVLDSGGEAMTGMFSIMVLNVTNEPTILPGSLPAVTVSNAVAIQLEGLNLAPPVQWSDPLALLPEGVDIDADAGVIYGAPTETGTFSFIIEAQDNDLVTASRPYLWTIGAPPAGPQMPAMAAPGGYAGVAYFFQTEAVGGAAPYIYTLLESALPSGFVFYAATASIAGRTDETGMFHYVVRAMDTNGLTATRLYAFSVIETNDLRLETSALPDGWVGKNYQVELKAGGGTSPYAWQVASGDWTLPPGISRSASILNGTPTTGGVFWFTLRVTDNDGRVKEKFFSLHINPVPEALAFATSELPGGVYGEEYETYVLVKGGIPPYAWEVLPGTGAPPPGVMVLPDTGLVGGFPTSTGLFSFVCRVTDQETNIIQRLFTIQVEPQDSFLQFITAMLHDGSVFGEYYDRVDVCGGSPPYQWSLVGGSLPVGVTLATNTGFIIGTPSSTGWFKPLIQVTDTNSHSIVRLFQIAIDAMPSKLEITTEDVDDGYVSNDYEFTFSLRGGKKPYTWSQPSGALPPGLLFDTDGTLAGLPTEYGAWAFSVRVRDVQGSNYLASFVIKVFNDSTPEITTDDLPNGKVGMPFAAQLEVFGGTPPIQWRIVSGSLPPGLALSTNSGAIAGTVSTTNELDEEYQFDVEALDFAGESDIATLAIPLDTLDVKLVKSASFKVNWNVDKYDLDSFSMKFDAVMPALFTGFVANATTLYVEFADYSASSDYGTEKISGKGLVWSSKAGDARPDREFGGRMDVPVTVMKLTANPKKNLLSGSVRVSYDDNTGSSYDLDDTVRYLLTNYGVRVELVLGTNMVSLVGSAQVLTEYKNGGKGLTGSGRKTKPK